MPFQPTRPIPSTPTLTQPVQAGANCKQQEYEKVKAQRRGSDELLLTIFQPIGRQARIRSLAHPLQPFFLALFLLYQAYHSSAVRNCWPVKRLRVLFHGSAMAPRVRCLVIT